MSMKRLSDEIDCLEAQPLVNTVVASEDCIRE